MGKYLTKPKPDPKDFDWIRKQLERPRGVVSVRGCGLVLNSIHVEFGASNGVDCLAITTPFGVQHVPLDYVKEFHVTALDLIIMIR